jgi:hypothetical protein
MCILIRTSILTMELTKNYGLGVFQKECLTKPSSQYLELSYCLWKQTNVCLLWCKLDCNVDDYQCTSNYVFLLNNETMNWSSKKQSCIDLSSIKAKYIVISPTTRQVMSFSSFFGIIGQLEMKSIIIYDDNHNCISLWKNLTLQACMKYIKIHHHFVQDKIEDGFIKLVYCNI